jgi:carbon storage regulator
MLVLSRLPGERIHVGTDITFTVLEVQGRQVRIGVTAPSEIRVFRHQLCSTPEPTVGHKYECPKTYECT